MEHGSKQLDPDSLTARLAAELRASADAQSTLMHALLPEEFLAMPKRLRRVEADVATLKTDVATLKDDVHTLKIDGGTMKGTILEHRLHRTVRPLLGQRLGLRRLRLWQSPLQDSLSLLCDTMQDALDTGLIDAAAETRVQMTDFIVQARRKADETTVLVAIEVSNRIDHRDIERARQSADCLGAVFGDEPVAAVAGYRIHPADQRRADEVGVHVLLTEVSEAA